MRASARFLGIGMIAVLLIVNESLQSIALKSDVAGGG
jgi:hypothetical protein